MSALVLGGLVALGFGGVDMGNSEFGYEFVPQPQVVQQDTTYGCVVCHADKRKSFSLGVHSDRGIRCHDCHGGDPSQLATPAAHRGSFIGAPSKVATVQLCASCHSDPNEMRQYALPVGQLAEFRTSRHGILLLRDRNMDAPTCTDCHDAHTILPKDDARSNVYPANIAATCSRCHEDAALMDKYGLSTDQVAQHRASAHGVGLYDKQNFASATCVSCHGSHTALPPAQSEISNVCSRCHAVVGRAFDEGPHGGQSASNGVSGCMDCHSDHSTERVPLDEIVAGCTGCHDAAGPEALVGVELQERAVGAQADLVAATDALVELVAAGWDITDTRFRYQTLLTEYQQIAQALHRIDLDRMGDLSLRVSSISRDIRGAAEVAAEHKWEHKLLLVPVWFLALAAVVLAWFKFRELTHEEHS